jgi:type VI secretion system protein ImpA
MMRKISIDELLLAISEDAPCGSDLRYTTVYEEIMEARRCESAIAMGDWQHDVKKANWDKVISLAVSALGSRSKDLQIAVWLTEALTVTEGFSGLDLGLQLVTGLVYRFWDTVYPNSEEGDLEYRATPFQFLNEKVSPHAKEIPITDPEATPGYSWLKWRQSREVGSEAGLRNRYGEIDEDKKNRRDELIAESALSAEEFDAAVSRSHGAFGGEVREQVARCRQSVQRLSEVLETKFAGSSPSLAELASIIDGCGTLLERLYGPAACEPGAAAAITHGRSEAGGGKIACPTQPEGVASLPATDLPAAASVAVGPAPQEHSLWGDALAMLEAGQLQEALAMLLYTSNGTDSVRDRNRVRLLMGKLCLKAGRAELARPIMEELHAVIEEQKLEHWESPLWIAEVLEAYYRCLQAAGPKECDLDLAQTLLRRICSLDITKAMPYRS